MWWLLLYAALLFVATRFVDWRAVLFGPLRRPAIAGKDDAAVQAVEQTLAAERAERIAGQHKRGASASATTAPSPSPPVPPRPTPAELQRQHSEAEMARWAAANSATEQAAYAAAAEKIAAEAAAAEKAAAEKAAAEERAAKALADAQRRVAEAKKKAELEATAKAEAAAAAERVERERKKHADEQRAAAAAVDAEKQRVLEETKRRLTEHKRRADEEAAEAERKRVTDGLKRHDSNIAAAAAAALGFAATAHTAPALTPATPAPAPVPPAPAAAVAPPALPPTPPPVPSASPPPLPPSLPPELPASPPPSVPPPVPTRPAAAVGPAPPPGPPPPGTPRVGKPARADSASPAPPAVPERPDRPERPVLHAAAVAAPLAKQPSGLQYATSPPAPLAHGGGGSARALPGVTKTRGRGGSEDMSGSAAASLAAELSEVQKEREAEEKLTPDQLHKKATARANVVKEVVSTEQKYVESLQTLIAVFMEPLQLKAEKYGLTADDLSALFSNVKQIASFHALLLNDLSKPNANIPAVIMQYSPFMKLYVAYVGAYDKTIEMMNKLKKNDKFQNFLKKKRKEKATNGLDIMSFLIMPVQRIPRYELLLRELQRYTLTTHPERHTLDQALHGIKVIAMKVNESKRRVERMSTILQAQNTIVGLPEPLFQPHRFLIKTGVLKHPLSGSSAAAANALAAATAAMGHGGAAAAAGAGGGGGVLVEYKTLLFNDLIVWCLSHDDRDDFKGWLQLHDGARVAPAPPKAAPNAITVSDTKTGQSVTFVCASADDAKEWMSAVGEALEWRENTKSRSASLQAHSGEDDHFFVAIGTRQRGTTAQVASPPTSPRG